MVVHSITKLLQRTAENITRENVSNERCSAIILCSTKTTIEEVKEKIKVLKRLCEDIIIGVREKEQEFLREIGEKADISSIKIVECHHAEYTTMSIEELMRYTLNDKVLFVYSDCKIATTKLMQKISALHSPIAGFIDNNGKIYTQTFMIKKWNIRFFLQILRLTARTTIGDLFRVMPSKTFMVINRDFIDAETTSLISFYTLTDQQDLIKMIALLRYLQDELINNKMIRAKHSFKIQQLLTIAKKTQKDNKFLAFLAPYYILHYNNYIEEMPITWKLDDVKQFAKETLKEEMDILKQHKLTQLEYESITDLLKQEILTEEERLKLEEKKKEMERKLSY